MLPGALQSVGLPELKKKRLRSLWIILRNPVFWRTTPKPLVHSPRPFRGGRLRSLWLVLRILFLEGGREC